MATQAPQKVEWSRSYNGNMVQIAANDDPVVEYDVTTIEGASSAAGSAVKCLQRYSADIVVGVGSAALKAEGGTLDSAVQKMNETIAALQKGEFGFRSASGSGELSDEEIIAVIASALVDMKKADTKENAEKIVRQVYALTKKNAKGYETRPDFNELKRVPAIKDAINKASKVDSGAKVDSVLSRLQKAE